MPISGGTELDLNIEKVSVIIPAYKPDEKLLGTIEGVINIGFNDIIVIDDGSGTEFEPVFDKVKTYSQCTLLRHEVNRGKGAALRTAFTYFMDNRPDMSGVVTADADGQHLPCDIAAVSDEMEKTGAVILGVRDFSDPSVPPRSKTGNKITSVVFRLFFGMKISDTQTGLRAFPRKYINEIATAKGDRYEFETNMLFLINKSRIPMGEVKISTVYIEENKSSHFRVVRDSLRIYGLIIKYLLSSVASAVIDVGIFGLLMHFEVFRFIGFIPMTWSAGFVARAVSSLTNYFLNTRVVFSGKLGKKTLIRYYILAVIQISVSCGIVNFLKIGLGVSSAVLLSLIKFIVDTLLFFVSFRVQHKWVFKNDK